MDFTALQTELQSLVQFGGYTNISPTPDYAEYVNKGLRRFSFDAEYNIAELTFTTVADQLTYSLTAPAFRTITAVWYDGERQLFRSNEALESQANPLWRQAASGEPTKFWMVNTTKMILHVPPSASSVNVLVRGSRVESDLSGGSDVPVCQEEYRRAIALFGAVELMKRYATQDELEREKNYLAEYNHLLNEYRALLRSQNAATGRRVTRFANLRVR